MPASALYASFAYWPAGTNHVAATATMVSANRMVKAVGKLSFLFFLGGPSLGEAVLVVIRTKNLEEEEGNSVELRKIFPFFILYFVAASVITTVAVYFGVPAGIFSPLKTLSKFFIVMAMGAIGLNTNVVKLIKTGGKPIFMGACCWAGITCVSLVMQKILGIW